MKKLKEKLNLNNYTDKQLVTFLFILSFFAFIVLGLLISYNYDFSNSYNLFFESDNTRVINDASEPLIEHSRLTVHPLYVIFVEPIFFLINGLTQNKMLALIILSALISSLSVVFVYKIFSLFHKENNFKVILSLIYLFSISNYIYTSCIEIYNLAALFLILLWYYFLKKLKNNNLDKKALICLIILGLFSLAFTITNFFIFLIIIFVLFISKKINLKKALLIPLCTLVLLAGFNYFQNLVWGNTPILWEGNFNNEKEYTDDLPLNIKVQNVLKEDYLNPLIASNIFIKVNHGLKYTYNSYYLSFANPNFIKIILMVTFYALMLILLWRNFKRSLYINIGLLLSLLFNSLLHLIYGNDCAFLYTLHFLYLIILTFGINLAHEKNNDFKKFISKFLIIFLIVEIIANNLVFLKIIKLFKNILQSTYYLNTFGFIKTFLFEIIAVLVLAIPIFIIIKNIKNLKRKRNEDKIIALFLIFISFVFIECTFLTIQNTTITNKFLGKKITPNQNEVVRYNKIYYLKKDFKTHFSKEIDSLNEYMNEYEDFIKHYQCNTPTIGSDLLDYYFFGLGNRRKIIFKNNKLIALDTNKVLYKFVVKERLIVPNEYAVLIQTVDNEFIKIYEDEAGVHYQKDNKDTIIEGTNNKLNLFSFENQKYQNIKKELYSEILFNIKDSKIYPNIMVYNKPKYTDAAIVSMVLKETNNTDLIKNWVLNIKNIDNVTELGQLLYILSTQEDVNENIINEIIDKANSLAEANEKGHYLDGKNALYKNLWYKLGLEAVGKNFTFDINDLEEDNYSSTAWWSDYSVKNIKLIENYAHPYLNIGQYHKSGQGPLTVNYNYYPLSWEYRGDKANYSKMAILHKNYKTNKVALTHSRAASEFLLFLLDETNDLKEK